MEPNKAPTALGPGVGITFNGDAGRSLAARPVDFSDGVDVIVLTLLIIRLRWCFRPDFDEDKAPAPAATPEAAAAAFFDLMG